MKIVRVIAVVGAMGLLACDSAEPEARDDEDPSGPPTLVVIDYPSPGPWPPRVTYPELPFCFAVALRPDPNADTVSREIVSGSDGVAFRLFQGDTATVGRSGEPWYEATLYPGEEPLVEIGGERAGAVQELSDLGELIVGTAGVPTRVNEGGELVVRAFTADEVARIVQATPGIGSYCHMAAVGYSAVAAGAF